MAGVTLTLHRAFFKDHIAFDLPTDENSRAALAGLLQVCRDKNNDYVTVSLSRPRKPRTTGPGSQNHHLNGHIMQICQETGNDYDTVKNCIKQIAVENFGFPFQTVAGHVIPKAERETSTEECAQLIEASHYLAADLGLILREE